MSGPSKVMWAIHDDIRMMIREFRSRLVEEKAAELVTTGRRLSEMMADMIYKEEKILLPMSLETLDEADWARVKRGEEEIGYAWVTPGAAWKPAAAVGELPAAPEYRRPAAAMDLDTGALTPEQVNLLLKNLPLDVTFVDEADAVRYYSAGAERVFPRSPGIIGRKVRTATRRRASTWSTASSSLSGRGTARWRSSGSSRGPIHPYPLLGGPRRRGTLPRLS